MEFQKIVNFLDATSDNEDLWRFVTKNGLKFMINQKEIPMLTKNRIKTPMLRADICDFSAYIVVKADIVVTAPDNAKSSWPK